MHGCMLPRTPYSMRSQIKTKHPPTNLRTNADRNVKGDPWQRMRHSTHPPNQKEECGLFSAAFFCHVFDCFYFGVCSVCLCMFLFLFVFIVCVLFNMLFHDFVFFSTCLQVFVFLYFPTNQSWKAGQDKVSLHKPAHKWQTEMSRGSLASYESLRKKRN